MNPSPDFRLENSDSLQRAESIAAAKQQVLLYAPGISHAELMALQQAVQSSTVMAIKLRQPAQIYSPPTSLRAIPH